MKLNGKRKFYIIINLIGYLREGEEEKSQTSSEVCADFIEFDVRAV